MIVMCELYKTKETMKHRHPMGSNIGQLLQDAYHDEELKPFKTCDIPIEAVHADHIMLNDKVYKIDGTVNVLKPLISARESYSVEKVLVAIGGGFY